MDKNPPSTIWIQTVRRGQKTSDVPLPHPGRVSTFSRVSTVVAKITHRCNMDCTYCYEDIGKGVDMNIARFHTLVGRIARYSNADSISFVLHGGEPTLLPDDWFEEAASVANMEGRLHGKKIRLSAQTNFLTITEEKLAFFQRLGISLSASIDGSIDSEFDERPHSSRVARNLKMAIDLGARPGILATINASNWSNFSAICKWLHSDLGVRKFKANPISKLRTDQPSVTPEQISQAYKDIAEYMFATGGEFAEDNLRLEIRRFLYGRETVPRELCRERTCGAGREVISVNVDGDVMPCGRFEWNDSSFFIGTLGSARQHDNLSADSIRQFHAAQPTTWSSCASCSARAICSFGCQAFVLRSPEKLNVDCIPTKLRYQFFLDNRQRIERIAHTLFQ